MNEETFESVRPLLHRLLLQHGYSQRGKKWVKQNDETIVYVSLRKHTIVTGSIFVDFGFNLKYVPIVCSRNTDWHISGSLGSLDTTFLTQFKITDGITPSDLIESVNAYLLPFLGENMCKANLLKNYVAGQKGLNPCNGLIDDFLSNLAKEANFD